MKEINDIVTAYENAVKRNKKTALATVVLVEGSAYRRAGARMLITEDGELTGAISGGCLEGDALRKARMAIMQQEPMLVTYDTMDDDDAKLGLGLGCNGIIHILIEPVNQKTGNPVSLLKSVLKGNAVLATLFSMKHKMAVQPGTCGFAGEVIPCTCPGYLVSDVKRVLANRCSETINYDNGYTGFMEYLKPPISLVVIGAGNDAIPLIKIAAVLGWDITLVDGRPNYVTHTRFPMADRTIISRAEDVLSNIELTETTAFVLMTHNYNYELALLGKLLPLGLPYIGLLGPRKKLERMLAEIEDQGSPVTEQHMHSLYGPVGLDIGSESSEEIALSVIAEIKAVFSGRNGHSLKYKSSPIHAAV